MQHQLAILSRMVILFYFLEHNCLQVNKTKKGNHLPRSLKLMFTNCLLFTILVKHNNQTTPTETQKYMDFTGGSSNEDSLSNMNCLSL